MSIQQMFFASLAAGGGYVINGSGLFDGASTSFLTRTPSSAGNSKKFKIHAVVKRASLGAIQSIVGANSAGTFKILFDTDDTINVESYYSSAYKTRLITTQVFRDVGAYYAIDFEYDSTVSTPSASSIKLLVNGVQITAFNTATYPSQNEDAGWNLAERHRVGGRGNATAQPFNGYIARVVNIDGVSDDVMGEITDDGFYQLNDVSGLTFGTNGFLLSGQNLSTGTDSQAGGTPAEQQIQALFHMDGSDAATSFTDNSTYGRTWAAGGNAQLDTAIKKFGTASLLLDGTGDDVAIANDATWMDIATQNFTMDCWVYFTAVANNQTFISKWTGSGNQRSWNFAMNGTSGTPVLEFQCTANGSTTVTVSESWSPSATTWYHVAVERTGGKINLYVDGTKLGSGTSNTTDLYTGTAEIAIGTLNAGAAEPFAGNIDEVRIVIGTGVYGGSNFTVASAAYANPATANNFTATGITATNDSPTNGDA